MIIIRIGKVNSTFNQQQVSHCSRSFDSRFGYKRAKLALRIRIIKALCEAQFDLNARFKLNINKLEAKTLRHQPVRCCIKKRNMKSKDKNNFTCILPQIGKDKLGNCYWFQVDPEANVRVYREDLDDETWELVASNRFLFLQFFVDADLPSTIREELASLVELLTDKETFDRSVSQEEPEEEDSMQVGNK